MRRYAMTALALLLVAGCGGDPDPKPGASGSPTPTGTGTAVPSATASRSATPGTGGNTIVPGTGTPASPGSTTAPGSPGSSPGGSRPASQPPQSSGPPATDNAKLEARLTNDCVERARPQTLALDTYPDMFVVFDTQYSDGKDGQVYGGIETNGRSDFNGHYQKTWVLAPNTPLGDARVDIAVAGKYKGENKTAVRQLHFRVALSC